MKIKKIIYGFLASFLLAPVVAMADWTNTGMAKAQTSLLPAGTISGIITQIMNWFLMIVGVVAIISFVVAGILYFLAAGDEGKMGTAKNAMTYSIIGVVVALIGYVIIQAVNSLLGGASSTF